MPEPTRDGQLSVSVLSLNGCAVLALTGESDVSVAARWREELRRLAAPGGPSRVVVDLSQLRFMGARGARVLLEGQQALIARGASLAITGAAGEVARVLQLTGADQQIPVYPDLRAAVQGRIPELPDVPRAGL